MIFYFFIFEKLLCRILLNRPSDVVFPLVKSLIICNVISRRFIVITENSAVLSWVKLINFSSRGCSMPYYNKQRGKWQGQVKCDGRKYRKLFDTKQSAKSWEIEKLSSLERRIIQPALIPIISLGDWAVQYLDYSKVKHSRKTYEEKQRAFRSFFKSVDRFLAADQLHKRTVLDHLSAQAQARSGYAANKERKNFVAAWNWAAQYIPGFPAQNPFLVERFSEDRTARYVPSEEDFWKVYGQAESEQDRVMLLCFLHLAARRNEIFHLRTEDIDLIGRRVRLYTRKRKDGSRCYDWVPMSGKLHQELSVYILTCTGEWVFPDSRSGFPYAYRQKWLPRLCRMAGVKKFTLHAIRHLSASILIKNRVPSNHVQAILRHHKLTTTERYIHHLESYRSAVEVF
ncbi:MAG: site-specific integrase [Candidatus Electrothrix sp. AUS1_2]|nr:site-specific integrase [Candidatus Electrothrix sp. AUS1_2]